MKESKIKTLLYANIYDSNRDKNLAIMFVTFPGKAIQSAKVFTFKFKLNNWFRQTLSSVDCVLISVISEGNSKDLVKAIVSSLPDI